MLLIWLDVKSFVKNLCSKLKKLCSIFYAVNLKTLKKNSNDHFYKMIILNLNFSIFLTINLLYIEGCCVAGYKATMYTELHLS